MKTVKKKLWIKVTNEFYEQKLRMKTIQKILQLTIFRMITRLQTWQRYVDWNNWDYNISNT